MAKKPRTFIVKKPVMHGVDVSGFQLDIRKAFAKMNIDCPIKIDGRYGESTRSYAASLVYASGMSAKTQMAHGVTPELRIKLRNGDLTAAQEKAKKSPARTQYRAKIRKQWAQKSPKVHSPVKVILQDDWGYHPPVHDGVDVITHEDAVLFTMVKCKIIDVRKDGWWGKGAPADPKIRGKGDGIVQYEVLENVGPFKKGMHIGYGHAEHAKAFVKVGAIVEAGTPICKAGLANVPHIHLMVNDGSRGTSGVGNIDPRKFLDYAVKNG